MMKNEYDEFKHVDTQKIIKSINLYDRCKCEKCQKEVKLLQNILTSRANS